MDETWRGAWTAALDELELTVEHAEELLRANDPEPLPAWEPPTLTGPPPPEQLARAHVLLERHQRVTRELTQAITATRQQLAMTAKVAQTRAPEVPVYLDVNA